MAKRKVKDVNSDYSVYKLPVSKFIDTKFREYALYVLQSRGIPSFYDGLTPVQRYILMNSTSNFAKTLSLVGKCMADGYHHGNLSLEKAIAKLARPFGSSIQMLEGYGFFGTEVSPEPAAARYTSVRISPIINDIIKKYKHLIEKDSDGAYKSFWTEIPIGLLSTIVGISVGYSTTVLPRKLEDIQEYLRGERKRIKPYFKDFKGKISKYDKDSWIITSNISTEQNRIKIRGIPPIVKYANIIKKLDALIKKYENSIKIINNSNTEVTIDIVYSGKKQEEWDALYKHVKKIFSVIVREKPIFIKDKKVLVYDNVEQYLDDFKWQLKRLHYFHIKYLRNELENELAFNKVKKKFITFILQKRRSYEEVDEFLKDFPNFKNRLENMTSKKFTKSELDKTIEKIQKQEEELKNKKKEEKEAKKEFNSFEDPTSKRGISSKSTSNTSLFDHEDVSEVDGIVIWNGNDINDKEENNED